MINAMISVPKVKNVFQFSNRLSELNKGTSLQFDKTFTDRLIREALPQIHSKPRILEAIEDTIRHTQQFFVYNHRNDGQTMVYKLDKDPAIGQLRQLFKSEKENLLENLTKQGYICTVDTLNCLL